MKYNILIGTDLNQVKINDEVIIKRKPTQDEPVYSTLMQNSIKEHEIFSVLLNQMEPIDFAAEADKTVISLRSQIESTNDPKILETLQKQIEKKEPSEGKKHVIFINKVLELAEKNGFGLGVYNGVFNYYNAMYWEEKDNETLNGFLAEIAEKAGINPLEAQQFKVKELFFRQFQTAAPIPGFNSSDEEIKIPLQNGTLIIRDGKIELTGFRKKDFLKYILNFKYDPNAKAPIFQKFLDRVLPDKNAQLVIFEYLGSMFTKIRHEKMLVLFGNGKNGKSVIADVVYGIFGRQNVTAFDLESLCDQKSQTRAKLENALINFCSEIGSGKINIDIFKKLVSGDPVEVKEIYQKPRIIEKYARLAFNCNMLPRDVENSEGFIRRFIIVPFNEVIKEEEKDLDLAKKIIATESAGILNMIIEGLQRLICQRAFTKSESIDEAIENYRKNSNSVLSFLDDEGWEPSVKSKIQPEKLYGHYRDYCSKTGFRPFNIKNFKTQLKNENFEIRRTTNGYVRIFCEQKGIENVEFVGEFLDILSEPEDFD